MSTIAIVSSASISRETFSEANNYQRLIFQQGKPLLDAELNEMQESIFDYFSTFLANAYGDVFVDTAMLAAEATASVNNFQIGSGEVLLGGIKGYLGSAMTYASQAWVSTASTPNEVYITKLLWNHASAVPALTTPSGGDRDDLVVMSLVPREIDGTIDSGILDPNFASETARRYKFFVGLTVLEGFGSYPIATGYAASFSYDNPQCIRKPIAWLRRTDGVATVATAMINDIREEVFDTGETLFAKYRAEIANAGNEANKVSKYRGGLVPIAEYTLDTTHRMARLLEVDGYAVTEAGATQGIQQQFQIYPVNMVDASQEVTSGSYNVLTSLSELAANIIPFSPALTGKYDSAYHSRLGFFVHTKGSGYSTLQVELHNVVNSVLFSTNFVPASLTDSTWNYADVVASSLSLGSDYHYHVYMAGFTTGSVAIMGMGTTAIAFREFYKPNAGKFGGVNTNDVAHLFDKSGAELVAVRGATSDDITVSGGFIASGHDYVAVDFSAITIWSAWSYYDFIGVDLTNGRLKFPASIDCRNVLANFNSAVSLGSIETKDILMHNSNQHLREKLHDMDTTDLQAASEITQNSNTILQIQTELERERQLNLQQELELSYIMGRKAQNSDMILEPYFNKDLDGLEETSTNKPSEYQCDNDWNNNWKQRDGSPESKNGYMRPRKQPYMLEVVDEYDLEGVGQALKGAIKYDSTNECYWMISNAGQAAIGEITKLHKSMADGKVQVLARWYIPAGAASTEWAGIETNGSYLFFTLKGSDAASKIYKLKINTDGTLGETATAKKNGETFVLATDCAATANNAGTGYYNDLVLWDADTLMVILCNAATAVTLVSIAVSNLGDRSGTVANKTGFVSYIGGSGSGYRSCCLSDGNLWIRINEPTDDKRFIYKFVVATDIVSNAVIKASGRFECSRNVDETAYANGGVCIGHHGDLLEVTSTTSNGKFISRRALKNALWAENQVRGELKCYASTNPSGPMSCMVEYTGGVYYYWTSDTNASANEIDLYRFCPSTGAYKHARLTNQAWTYLYDLTYNPNTDVMYIIGYDGTNYEVFFGDLSDFVALMGDTYNVANTITIGTAWGTIAAGIGAASTDVLRGICYDSDADIILILNDSDDKIDTLSLDGATWTQAVYDLPAPTSFWAGISYKNGNIYVGDGTGATTPSRIYTLNKSKCTASAWWRSHIHQDPSPTFVASGRTCFDFMGNDIVAIHYTNLTFTTMKVLEDPDVMQLHTFMDVNNILLSSNVSCETAIAERYFDPEDFADQRDMPDLHYCAVGYGDNGISELHLDEYLSGKSSTMKDRYDVSKIRVRHYKRGANNIMIAAAVIGSIFIDRDIIFVGDISNSCTSWMIDLKSGKATQFYNASTGTGTYYNGTLSQRNDGLATAGSENAELVISSRYWRKIHARTFFKEDASDYNLENPKTYVSIGTDGGNDVLVIDWDENGNRTPVKVWNNLMNDATYGQYACWIAPSGILPLADYEASGGIIYSTIPVWQIAADSGLVSYYKGVGSSILGGYAMDISPNSRCWKTPSGTWRHQLVCAVGEATDLSGIPAVAIVDVENATKETVWSRDGLEGWVYGVDNFEDSIMSTLSSSHYGYFYAPFIFKKQRFLDKMVADYANGWALRFSYDDSVQRTPISSQRPIFTLAITASTTSCACPIRYSKDFGIMSTGYTVGLQFFHIGQLMDECLSETTVTDLTKNPRSAFLVQNGIFAKPTMVSILEKGSANVAYNTGASIAWVSTAAYHSLAYDGGATEGWATISSIYGADYFGVLVGYDPKGANIKVNVYNAASGVTLVTNVIATTYITTNVGTDNIQKALWVALPSLVTCNIRIEHAGTYSTLATAPFEIRVASYLVAKECLAGSVVASVVLSHASFATWSTEYALTAGAQVSFNSVFAIAASGTNDTFVLAAGNRAYEFTRVGVLASGATVTDWYWPTDPEIASWGGDAAYSDSAIAAVTANFGAVFAASPSVGTVFLEYIVAATSAAISLAMFQPSLADYTDYRAEVRLLDWVVEFVD